MATKTARHWNIRWVLAMLCFALMGLTALLEIFAVFREVGTVPTAVFGVVGLYFGLTAATGEVVDSLYDDIRMMHDDVRTIGVVLERMEPAVRDRLEPAVREGFDRMGRLLESIERILIERLPRSTRLPRKHRMTATCPKHPTSSSAARPARAARAVAS